MITLKHTSYICACKRCICRRVIDIFIFGNLFISNLSFVDTVLCCCCCCNGLVVDVVLFVIIIIIVIIINIIIIIIIIIICSTERDIKAK